MNSGYEPVHKVRHFLEVWGKMIPNINRLLPKSAAELRDIGNRDVVERPQGVFVQGRMTLYEADFDASGQKIILSDQVLLLNPIV